MLKDILEGSKEVLLELFEGMRESSKELWERSMEIFEAVDVKLMGSYEEIEAFEKEKESKKSA